MCLVSKWCFPRKAKKDIVCFKVLKKSPFYLSEWCTPFRSTPVTLNNWIIADKCKTFSILFPHNKGAGYVHAYTDKRFVWKENAYAERVFVAIIPKGTKYHISRYGKEICAEKMFITNEQLD